MIYEPYIHNKNDILEFGYTFRADPENPEGDTFDLVLGQIKAGPTAQTYIKKICAENEWAAKAIMAAAPDQEVP